MRYQQSMILQCDKCHKSKEDKSINAKILCPVYRSQQNYLCLQKPMSWLCSGHANRFKGTRSILSPKALILKVCSQGPRASAFIWEFIRNAKSQAPSQNYWIRIWMLIRSPGGWWTHYNLRSTVQKQILAHRSGGSGLAPICTCYGISELALWG